MDKYLFIVDLTDQEASVRREFEAEVLQIKFVSGSRYLGVFMGSKEYLEEWVCPQVKAWAHGVHLTNYFEPLN